jgi:pathogenesis-related protein 1
MKRVAVRVLGVWATTTLIGCSSGELGSTKGGNSSGSGSSSGTEETATTDDCTDSWCESIVSEHNKIRAAVNDGTYFSQPKADPPLAMVVWDSKIADKAQAYADTVTDFSQGHSSSEYRTYTSSYVDGYHGENIAIGGGNYSDPAFFVAKSWGEDEAQNCTLSSCGGHYTQIVWRETIAVGCGKKDDVSFGNSTGTLVICQYAEGGNINGRAPY